MSSFDRTSQASTGVGAGESKVPSTAPSTASRKTGGSSRRSHEPRKDYSKMSKLEQDAFNLGNPHDEVTTKAFNDAFGFLAASKKAVEDKKAREAEAAKATPAAEPQAGDK
jgi:hypothetical protein